MACHLVTLSLVSGRLPKLLGHMLYSSPMTDQSTWLAALKAFAANLTTTFAQTTVAFQPEDQLKGVVEALVKHAGTALNLPALQIVTEVKVKAIGGRPDMGVSRGGALIGYIELKAPGKGARPQNLKGEDKRQWEKFKNLPNLIYTDGNEWALFRTGEPYGERVRLSGDVTRDGAQAVQSADAAALLKLFQVYFAWQAITPSTPKGLAQMLAPICRLLRDEVIDAMNDPASNLSSLADDWRRFFFPDADANQFADAYAQTLTYALLLARLSGAGNLSVYEASKRIQGEHRLLSDVLKRMGDDAARSEIQIPADLLEHIITAVDPAIFASKGDDPWLYFYEDFLEAYDPKMRKDRGVYYTPAQVVQCQVRLVAELLADRFDAEYSFVDTNVVTLDPATGTGTYILAAIRHGLDQVERAKGPGARLQAATTAAQNVHAFELLIGPYAVAHLRLSQLILGENAPLPADGPHIYLNDTLDSPNAAPPGYLPMQYRQLADEHRRANRVKEAVPVLVCIGNPPYDRQMIDEADRDSIRRKGGWVRFGEEQPGGGRTRPIFADFTDPLAEAGLGVHAKNLYNDYVYFWRWALWKVFEHQPGYGIVSFITAASYLRGPGFAGMRKVMRETFDELWIIDLEGDNLGARKTENVFAIQTPVAIATGVRYAKRDPATPATVHYTRISGSTAEKLAALAAVEQFADLPWRPCFTGWTQPLLPAGDTPYWNWPLLTDLFPWQANGMQFKRTWPISESRDVLERRWETFLDLPAAKRGPALRETDARTINKAASALNGSGNTLPAIASLSPNTPPVMPQRYAFRSFDRQWVLPDTRLCDRPRPELQRAHSDRQIYMISLLTAVLGEGPAAVSTALIPDLHHFRGSFGGAHVIPLWRDATGTQPNIANGLLEALTAAYGVPVTAEDVFAYCYALLVTPDYVARHWDELTIPGPRVPVTRSHELFEQGAALGKQLLWLHSFGQRFVPHGKKAGRLPPGRARIAVGTPTDTARYPKDFGYTPATGELRIGNGLFTGVRADVWSFSVSGLRVVDSWLGYRMLKRAGKSSSPLDELRPHHWQFDDELLELLWMLEAALDLLPQASVLLTAVAAGPVFTAAALPIPGAAERRGPGAPGTGELPLFDAAGLALDEPAGDDAE